MFSSITVKRLGWELIYTIIIFFPFPYSNNLHIDPKIHEHCWKEMENVKTQLEEQHAQAVEHLRSYFQQQLKDSEERYTAEIVHLQDKLRSDEVSSDCTRYNQFFNAYNFVLRTDRSAPNNCSCRAMYFTLKFEKLFINTSLTVFCSFKRCWLLPRNYINIVNNVVQHLELKNIVKCVVLYFYSE